MTAKKELRVLHRRKKVSDLSLALAYARRTGAAGGKSDARNQAATIHKKYRKLWGPEKYRNYVHSIGSALRQRYKLRPKQIKD